MDLFGSDQECYMVTLDFTKLLRAIYDCILTHTQYVYSVIIEAISTEIPLGTDAPFEFRNLIDLFAVA